MVNAAGIERTFVGPHGHGYSLADIDVKLRNAPPWVLAKVRQARAAAAIGADADIDTTPTMPTAMPAAAKSQRWSGWVAGIACCGVSNPAPLRKGDAARPETFTDDCLRKLFRQGNAGSRPTQLRWGHDGPPLVTSENRNLLFKLAPHFFGLEFEARLPDTAQCRSILDAIGDELVGVSIGFEFVDGHLVERDGQTVRVVTDANLDHVALIASSQGKPFYPAAWAAASRGHRDFCPARLSEAARLAAWPVIKQQAGCRS